jgi:RimJ/RimL family protein N-acetyltransferase
MPPGVYEIGIDVYDTDDRRRGIGTDALRLMVERLFTEERAHRVQATTDVDNAGMRGLSERCGFTYEGILRAFMPSPDGPRDYAMYAITKDDWEAAR